MAPLHLEGRRIAAFVAAATLLAGCSPGDGVGLDANGRPPGESGAGQPPPVAGANDFRTIQDTILTPLCAGCHAGASAPVGLRLDSANAYAALVNVPSVQVSSLRRVNPGDPTNSYLLQKLEGRSAVGSRMPLGGAPVSQAALDLVRGWIAGGARPPATGFGPPDRFVVNTTIPDHGEVALAAVNEISVVFNEPVDAVLASVSGQLRLFNESTGQEVALQSVSAQEGNDMVLKLRTAAALPPGSYELRVNGSGATKLAGVSGRVLNSDFSAAFLVTIGGGQ